MNVDSVKANAAQATNQELAGAVKWAAKQIVSHQNAVTACHAQGVYGDDYLQAKSRLERLKVAHELLCEEVAQRAYDAWLLEQLAA